jgi:hypothetical protein
MSVFPLLIPELIHPPEHSGNYQQKHLAAIQKKLGEEVAGEFCLRNISFILVGFFNVAAKSNDMGPTALLPFRRKSCYGFYRP